MDIPALAVGTLIAILTTRGLINGSAAVDGQGIRRDKDPVLYWPIMVASALAAGFLIYKGFAT